MTWNKSLYSEDYFSQVIHCNLNSIITLKELGILKGKVERKNLPQLIGRGYLAHLQIVLGIYGNQNWFLAYLTWLDTYVGLWCMLSWMVFWNANVWRLLLVLILLWGELPDRGGRALPKIEWLGSASQVAWGWAWFGRKPQKIFWFFFSSFPFICWTYGSNKSSLASTIF